MGRFDSTVDIPAVIQNEYSYPDNRGSHLVPSAVQLLNCKNITAGLEHTRDSVPFFIYFGICAEVSYIL